MKKSFLIMFLAGLCYTVIAQQRNSALKIRPAAVKNLTVADKVPDIFIPEIINYKSHSAKLSDFKSDLIIVDFWSINCSGCVAGLPKMKALQDKFGDSLKVLPVTYDAEKTTLDFWKKNRYTKGLDLVSVVGDKIFEAYFKHLGVPHEVWIYKGRVAAITFADYVTESNVRMVLKGKPVLWPVKNDFIQPFDFGKPILQVDNKQYPDSTGPVKYAAITGYREMDIAGKMGTKTDTVRHSVRSYFINETIVAAYLNYWQKLRDPQVKNFQSDYPEPSHWVLEVKKPLDYADVEQTGEYLNVWHKKHLFCYEAISPDTGQTAQQLIKSDLANLDFLLGLHGRFETRKVKCLVLVKTGEDNKLRTDGGYGKIAFEHGKVIIRNINVSALPYNLNKYIGNPPVFDESNFTGNVDMDLTADSWTDISGLRTSLQAYGLDLKEEERQLEVFVLTATR